MSEFSCQSETVDGGCLVRLAGTADATAIPSLERCFAESAAAGHRLVVVDLSDMTFVNSIGMGLFLNLRKSVTAHGGAVRFAAPRPLVADALRRVRLYDVLDIRDSLEAALSSA